MTSHLIGFVGILTEKYVGEYRFVTFFSKMMHSNKNILNIMNFPLHRIVMEVIMFRKLLIRSENDL